MFSSKLVGLVGGLSWVSTAEYYATLNRLISERLGKSHSARCLLHSVDFQDVSENNASGDWEANYRIIHGAVKMLADAGVNGIALCANTPHMYLDRLREEISTPFIHIAEAAAKEIARQGIAKVGLLGTKFTMEMPFFHEALARAGIEVLTPNDDDRKWVHDTIFSELTKNEFTDPTRSGYLVVINKLVDAGAKGVIMGCTEIPLLLEGVKLSVPGFDTTKIHCEAIVDFALS